MRPPFMIRATIGTVLVTLPLFFWNCSGVGKPFAGLDLSSSSTAGSGYQDLSSSYVKNPGDKGPLAAYQDRIFDFKPSAAGQGPYTASGIPAWATFNSTTGEVNGIPVKMADGFTFTMQGATSAQVFGPFVVGVVGNPLKEYQWHLKNTGQTAFALDPGTAGEDMHLSNSVALGYTGRGVRVAISDSGVMIGHEGLVANLLEGESRNYLHQTTNWLGDPTPDLTVGDNAHGTAVSTLALEQGWNGHGGRGVAPQAHFAGFLYIEAQEYLSSVGRLAEGTLDQFNGNFDVFNYSWNDPQCFLLEYSDTLKDKLRAGVTSQRGGKGSVYVMAAGNNFSENIQDCAPNLTASYVYANVNFSEMNTVPYVVNIAAVNAKGESSSYSSPGSGIWVSATGGEYGSDHTITNGPPSAPDPAMIAGDFYGCSSGIKSANNGLNLFDKGSAPNTDCRYTSTMNGTSAATPVSTGVVALMLQANPNLTWRDVKYILAKTADKLTPAVVPSHPVSSLNLTGHPYDQGWVTNGAGFHFHNWYGFGRINVDNAVAMAASYAPGSLGTYQETNWASSDSPNVAIPDNNATGVSRTMQVSQALTIEAVQVRVTTTDCAGDTGIELTSPSGTKSVVMNYNSLIKDGSIQDHTFLSNAFLGESSAGTWTLNVVDAHAGCTATLQNWKLNFVGH